MNTMLSFAFVIIVLVFFHELGHFLIARLFKMKVDVFSVGMGPEIVSRKDKQGTIWRLALIPIGGYVRLVEGAENKHKKGSFDGKPVWQRFLVVLAGPVFSILLGWIIFVGIFSVLGKGEIPDYKTVGINKVIPDSPAESSGIKTGDIITKITVSGKDYKINNFQDMFVAVQSAGNKKVTINVKRSNENIKMNITPRAYTGSDGKLYYRIGVSGFPPVYTKTSLIETINMGTSATLLVVRMVYDSVVEMFSNGIETDKMGGPIKIAQMSGQSANMGILKLFEFMALLSINLGILNMIPIPVLDGGRLVLLMAEGVIRRPLPEKLVNPIMAISVIFMLSFFIFMIFVDLGIF